MSGFLGDLYARIGVRRRLVRMRWDELREVLGVSRVEVCSGCFARVSRAEPTALGCATYGFRARSWERPRARKEVSIFG